MVKINRTIRRLLLALGLALASSVIAQVPDSDGTPESLNTRADFFRLDKTYIPPPGEALHHHTAGFAKILCSAVFITGLDAADATANMGGFISPFDQRRYVTDIRIDRVREEVSLVLPDGVVRSARRYDSQGCIAHPLGETAINFNSSVVETQLPLAHSAIWPMGDVVPDEPWPGGLDVEKVQRALDTGFGPDEAQTLGLVVTWKGRLLGERYGSKVDIHTPLESWSMTKSLTGTLMGVLIKQGEYQLWQKAPIPEWQVDPNDPRQAIRIGDIMRMSSGIMINAPSDPDYDTSTYADHFYLYTGGVNQYHYAATRPAEYPPNTVGRYRNTDPVLTSYLIRLAVEGRGEDYHSFPQRALFDKLGIRNGLIETDPYGNFLGQGLAFMSARDWARLGNLYLQDGLWNGERILPEGYVKYASTTAPAWESDGRPVYGGAFFWVDNEVGDDGMPKMFSMRGAGGQSTTIIPSHEMVIVRIGKYTGASAGSQALTEMIPMLLKAVPQK
ncbi:MAG: serine hydrolase [Gammaproteobacteria bacterium]|nr:serine hydrolase [Gammaproteobacteria bacterium]MCY4356055.1 serine hydrolase [Gammaproteobacteria bacterium]